MRHRIIDKTILTIITIAATVLLTENVMAIHVCLILAAISVLSLDEIVKVRWLPFVIAPVTLICVIVNPIAILVVPSVIYVLVSKREKYEYIATAVVAVVTFCATGSFADRTGSLLIMLIAGYLAYSTAYYESVISHSESMFDEARQEALENARKRRELRESADNEIYTARLKERNRIAREIHDNVGHMLTRAVVQMQAVLVMNKDENIQPYLESVNSTVNDAMTNIRKSVHELHDDSIDLSIGINEAAAVLKERFEVEVTTSIDSPVSNEMKLQILGIIKECVTNIAKHSNGNKVTVEVVENVTFWRIKVYDNGSSEKLEMSKSSDFLVREGGIGLSNMKARADSLRGRLSVNGGAEGFTVMVTIPKDK